MTGLDHFLFKIEYRGKHTFHIFDDSAITNMPSKVCNISAYKLAINLDLKHWLLF